MNRQTDRDRTQLPDTADSEDSRDQQDIDGLLRCLIRITLAFERPVSDSEIRNTLPVTAGSRISCSRPIALATAPHATS